MKQGSKIGSGAEAYQVQQAYAQYVEARKDRYGVELTEFLPETWTYLGAGVSRQAVLAPSGTVYKAGLGNCNRTEHEAASEAQDRIRAISSNIARSLSVLYFPKTRLFEQYPNVLAMEYIDGEMADHYDYDFTEARRVASRLGVSADFHTGNALRMADGRFGLLDMGYEDTDSLDF